MGKQFWTDESNRAKHRAGCAKRTKIRKENKIKKWLLCDEKELSIKRVSVSKKEYILSEQGGKCAECNNPPMWNNKIIVFEVHHKDNNDGNNKRENLEMLCPNCHSQK
jgi:5-methylcytosine-specific restriction endonuclease McrA